MKIALKVVIEMTPAQAQEYCHDYGIDRSELRADVARYVENGIQSSAGLSVEDGCTTAVTVS